jgi:hypothetical protein
MGILRKLSRWNRSGALVIPRYAEHKRTGQINWPRCAICKRIVDSYGLEEDCEQYVELWGECSGLLLDPKTGTPVHGASRKHERMRSSFRITKGPGWSSNRLTDIVRRTELFALDGERDFAQRLTIEGVS